MKDRYKAYERQMQDRCKTGVDLMFLWQQFDQLFQDLHVKPGPVSSPYQRHKVFMGAAGETDTSETGGLKQDR